MLEVSGLHAGYGQGDVLFGTSFRVERGTAVCLLGKNGAGKSTIMRAIMGLIRPSQGRISFADQAIDHLTPDAIARRGIGYVPEDRGIFPRLTVEENLLVPRRAGAATLTPARAYDMFPILGERRRQQGGTLSGGEQQMLSIARALMGGPSLLLLDEPSEGLAPLVIKEIAGYVERLKSAGLTILLAEQNIGFAGSISDMVYVIDKGTVQFAGTFDELESDPELKRTHLFVARVDYGLTSA